MEGFAHETWESGDLTDRMLRVEAVRLAVELKQGRGLSSKEIIGVAENIYEWLSAENKKETK